MKVKLPKNEFEHNDEKILINTAMFPKGFPGDSVVEESPANAGDMGSIPDVGRSLVEENDNTLQYSGLGNPMDKGVWRARVNGVTKQTDMT